MCMYLLLITYTILTYNTLCMLKFLGMIEKPRPLHKICDIPL